METAKDILRIARDQVAEKHGYGDWLQIDMTDNEEHEKQEIKLSLSDEVALRFGDLIADKAWEAGNGYGYNSGRGYDEFEDQGDKSTFMKELFLE